ncbi:MAG TPA: class I SAM-dependent methyltransferase [Kofleriaceae bacterium]|jgi:ubiquinone/menaquinone biosynthesis C-methylase UbiE|nr:class I SAM-dependent methyltransferase [Kofleriaceae bacterium]
MTETNIDFAAIKTRQQGLWATGNYAVVGTTLQIVGETLCEALDLRAGSRVLDVAAGNGNVSLAAARRCAEVTSTDYVPSLLEAGRKRAEAEGLVIQFQEADAENLPFPDGSFDVVVSTFGVMFAPNQAKAAAELVRVCRPGGKIGLANWTPESFVSGMFKIIGKYAPPPAGVKPPALWGTRPQLEEFFGGVGTLQINNRTFTLRYLSSQHLVDVFRTYFGPINKLAEALSAEPEKQAAFLRDLAESMERDNRSGDGTLVLPSEYLEVVIEKKR